MWKFLFSLEKEDVSKILESQGAERRKRHCFLKKKKVKLSHFSISEFETGVKFLRN